MAALSSSVAECWEKSNPSGIAPNAGADTGFQKGGGVQVTVKYQNAAFSRACAQLFSPLYEVWGSPLDPPLQWVSVYLSLTSKIGV